MSLFNFIARLRARAAGQGPESAPQSNSLHRPGQRAHPDDDPWQTPTGSRMAWNFDFADKAEEEAVVVDPIAPKAASAGQGFANTLRHELDTRLPGNLCFSPFSIAEALTMAQAGAAGPTREEIESVLGYPGAADQLIELSGELHRRLLDRVAGVDSVLAPMTALWYQTGYPIQEAFVDTLKCHLSAEVYAADFAQAPDAAAQLVNQWVSSATRGKIQEILTRGGDHRLTRVLLISAVYLKARWSNQFAPESTCPRPFHLVDRSVIQVPMMRQRANFRAVRDPDMQALAMPYKDGKLSMVVILPGEGKFEKVQRELDAARLEGIIASLERRLVELVLPRFRIESDFSLRQTLESMGIVSAFGEKGADFSRISPQPDLAIDDVIHKTYIDVDETGTEAAAVSIVGMALMRLAEPLPFIRFQADRPFLFVIRDDSTGTPLFVGRVMDPRG